MTVDDKALVERLATAIKKSIGKQFNATPIHPNPSVEDWAASGGVLDLKQVAQALLPIISDRIEAQAAEIERLRQPKALTVTVVSAYDRKTVNTFKINPAEKTYVRPDHSMFGYVFEPEGSHADEN